MDNDIELQVMREKKLMQLVEQGKMGPPHFSWPVSKPGPEATPWPSGQRPINTLRSEQMVEVGYNQETGTPST